MWSARLDYQREKDRRSTIIFGPTTLLGPHLCPHRHLSVVCLTSLFPNHRRTSIPQRIGSPVRAEDVGGAESRGELLLRAAVMVPAKRYALAATTVVSVLVLLSALSTRGSLCVVAAHQREQDSAVGWCAPSRRTGECDGHIAVLELGSNRHRSLYAHRPNSSIMATFNSIFVLVDSLICCESILLPTFTNLLKQKSEFKFFPHPPA
jgi:hypothetical protein